MTATEHESTAKRQVSADDARQVAEAARETRWDKPSFGKELFLGRFHLELIHPHPRPDEAARAAGEEFLATLEKFCAEHIDSELIEHDARIPDDVIRGLAEIGAFGMKIDREYGGLGLTQRYYNKALMLVSSVNASVGALLSAHQSIGVPQPLKLFGSTEQKKAFLPRCARGEVSAFLLTEPDVGSDPARLHTTATPSADGSHYILDGTKLWTTNGVIADLLVVMAAVPRSEGHRGGITAFVVEAKSPGVTVQNRNAFMGLRGIENGVTRFEQVQVPAANLIGKEGQGLKIALTTLNTGRLSLPAICAGASKWSVRIAREWSSRRVQWGKPVGEHEAVAGKIAFMAATAFALEAVLDLSSDLADAGGHDIRIEAALAKLYGSEMAWQVVDELVQIRGGRGYETAASLHARGERGVPVEQVLRDMRINRIFEGSTEIMHLMIAREAVDAHLSVAGDVIDPDADVKRKARAGAKAGAFYAGWLPTLVAGRGQLPRGYAEFGPLATHLRFVERSARKLARQTFYGMARWQARMEYHQRYLARLVDIGAELYAMSAACVRADMIRVDEPAHADAARQLADTFCQQARLRVHALFDQLWTNSDEADQALATAVLAGKHEWLEEGILDPSIPGEWIAD